MPFISLNDETVKNAEAVMTVADRDISPFPKRRRMALDDSRLPQPRSSITDHDSFCLLSKWFR
jgi:hypothetical protein